MTATAPKHNVRWPGNYERKLMFSFGTVVFLLIVVVFVASNWFFMRAEKKNIDQLATTVTQVVSHSLNRVSFSGKYHTRNLVQELVEQNHRLSYIAVQNQDGSYFAHSDPQKNDKTVNADDISRASEVITSENQLILYRTVEKLPILEVLTPFRSGYEQQISGIVRVGISLEESNADLQLARLNILLLSIILAGVSLIIILRISRHYGGPVQQMAQTLQGMMDHAPMAIYMQTEEGTLVRTNHEFQKIFGLSANSRTQTKVGDLVKALDPQQHLNLDREVFSKQLGLRSEMELSIDDEVRTVLVSKFPVGYSKGETEAIICTFLFDITTTRDLENQLRQSQKMEAVGHLAGGVAHDFNNLLTGIIGYADLARMITNDNEELEDYLDQLLTAANRAAQLTQGLLAFSRKQVIDLSPVDLNQIVQRMESLLMRVIGEDISLSSQLAPSPVVILADGPQIEQTILNLATNSRDAMPEGGTLQIFSSHITIVENNRYHPDLEDGEYAMLVVSDTGCGIPLKVQDKVFEPFFTTKEVGKGTGLGLSMAYGIIKQHGGSIVLESQPQAGTTTRIFLPLATEAQIVAQKDEDTSEITGGHEKILLVEDEDYVRNLLERILMDAGYEVITADNGHSGLEIFQTQRDTFDLVLLDVVMPRMHGHEAYTRMRKIQPQLKALFISGYTANHIKQHTRNEENLNLLFKPVRRDDLLREVRKVLNAS